METRTRRTALNEVEVGASGGLSTARQVPRALEKGGREVRDWTRPRVASRLSCDGCFPPFPPPMEDAEPPPQRSAGPAPMNLPRRRPLPMISALWPLTCHIWRRTSKQAPVAAGLVVWWVAACDDSAQPTASQTFVVTGRFDTVVRSRQHVPFSFHVRGTRRVAAAGLSAARRRDMIHAMSTWLTACWGSPTTAVIARVFPGAPWNSTPCAGWGECARCSSSSPG